jgi:hypothetical protein
MKPQAYEEEKIKLPALTSIFDRGERSASHSGRVILEHMGYEIGWAIQPFGRPGEKKRRQP